MRTSNVLFSAAHFFVVFFVICLGCLFCAFPYAQQFRLSFIHFLQQEPETFQWIGGAILAFGGLLLLGFSLLNRRRFLRIQMGPAKTLVDEAIVQDYVQTYWKEKHPDDDVHVDVVVQKGETLEIIVPASKDWEGKVEEHLEAVQNDLGDRLSRRLGYYREFYLTLSDPF